ncbi:hypothetical protein [Lunatibacter salilacus]|uniref:hypothetical protein n=1 Tax=Lunatibacter salilacus TaxID=2483804 RepID=UPI00131C44AF|nr:hypothetical protein [Lunatibacter salilacus]
MAANVFSNKKDIYGIQLIDSKENSQVVVDVPTGNWGITWIDPGSGLVLGKSKTNHLEKNLT